VPVVLHREYEENNIENIQIKAGIDFGTLLLDGFGNGIMLSNTLFLNADDADNADLRRSYFSDNSQNTKSTEHFIRENPRYPRHLCSLIDSCAFSILQAARVRTTKTEFISCPGCGRTLFDLQTTIAKVKKHFSHLTHLKIGIMGCIVNGPGEMADADYGYVGAARGKISLYKKKECVEKNIPEAEAVEKLIELMKKSGDWHE
jgi:(E)-4-hydroxy-3-methylbut-2-enyl-diphosphate synthase